MKANDLRNIGLAAYRSENDAVQHLLQNIDLTALNHTKIQTLARGWIETVRSNHTFSFLHHFLNKHQLNSSEGIALMGLAESLLRIPDNDTADALLTTVLHNKILTKISLPLVREGVRLLGAQFVLGEDLTTALEKTDKAYLYSFDMLGEAAKTQNDADRYFAAYQSAIQTVGEKQRGHISIKCSALHPRYQYTQIERLKKELVPRMIELCALAKQYKIAITIDAEEYDRLQLSLCLIDQILSSAELKNWDGFGLAIQSYQKAALPVIDVCEDLAKKYKHRIMLRLVKGAYWDSEIKRAQEQGLAQYPVFTRKITTDVNYLACAQRILKSPDIFYPQFATHNAYTIAAILQITGDDRDFEFQRLHGMGEQLYKVIMTQESIKCRVYAPVGDYQHLLAYLVRRLIENGANTSFVHQVEDQNTPIESLIEDPIATLRHLEPKSHPDIPIPPDLYGKQRKNPIAFDLSDLTTREQVVAAISRASSPLSQSSPRRRGSIFQRL